ncbi:hypothetical protein ACU8KH_01081 [Lachancea thermotolerans]
MPAKTCSASKDDKKILRRTDHYNDQRLCGKLMCATARQIGFDKTMIINSLYASYVAASLFLFRRRLPSHGGYVGSSNNSAH